MELECDLSTIKNEEMLRKMWQQSEDINRKKEIRSHLYKLRESRLRDLYQGDIMSGNNAPGFGKDPLTPCHGDSLVDQSFQSLKSKEIRDSMSPTHDMKFHSLSLNHPNTTGWDVQTSSEVSPDGRAYRSETLAKTDGVEKIAGGLSEFKGRNEQRSSASHQGDDKNFVKKASESSNTHLQENVVIGDENSGRTEMKMSSTTSSSTSKVVSSSSTLETLGGEPVDNKYLMDNTERHHGQQQQHQHQQRLQQEHLRQQQQLQREHEQRISDQQATKQQRQQQFSEQYNRNRQETNSQQTSSNVETQKQHEESKRYIDMDKATPEYQQHVQFLMAQPGEVISNTVEYPKPNVKMITTVKRLPDGTIVKNKRYETEELRPGSENVHQRSTSTNQSNTQQNQSEKHVRDEENIHTRLQKSRENNAYTERSNLPQTRRPVDVTDNADVVRHIQDRNVHSDDVANVSTSFSSVQKSSRRFSTETTSETIEEYDDRSPNKPATRGAQTPQDFSTHGFPSVRPNKLTQEYPNDRPQGARPSDDFTTHGYPSERPQPDQYNVTDSRKPNSVVNTRGYPSVQPTKDGEMILVSSETTRTANQKTNRERVIETEDFSTQSFPAVKASSPLIEGSPRQGTPSRDYPSSPRRAQPQEDFSTHGFPSVRSPTKTAPDGEVILVSSETKRTANQKTNREHIIETVINDNDYPRSGPNRPENITYTTSPHRPEDFSTHGFPSVKESSPLRDGSPRHGTPTRDYPSSPRRSQPNDNYSTHGFPSARSPTRSTPDYSRGSPSTRDTPKSGVKPTSVTTEATKKLLHKEKETDASHRAFAASLRSSSPIDNTRRDSYSENQRQTPRSSISSTKTFRRDQREGSHDSTAPSETSRISSNTVTRQSPSKSVGKTVVTKQTVVKTKNVNDSNETADLTPQRFTKSPSPAKTITTTTTTKTTTTRKSPTTDVPKSDNQKTKPAEILFPINEPLTITKTHLSSNDASFPRNEVVEVVEEPCLKKHFYRLGPSDNTPIVSDAQSQLFTKKITNNDRKTTTPHTDIVTTKTTDRPLLADLSYRRDFPETRDPTTLAAQKHIEKKTVMHVTYTNNQEQHEKSPSSPAPSSSKVHTHPKNQSPMRDDNIKIYDEPINEPSSPYDTEHTDRNQVPSKLPISNPTIIRQQKEPSIERRTDVRETTIEKREKTKKFPQEGESRYIDHETKPDHFDEPLSESDIEPSNGEQLPINKPKKPSFNQTKTLPMSSEPSSKPTNKPGPQKSTTNTVETTFDTTFHRNEAEVIKGPNKNIPKAEESPQKPTAKLIDVDDDYQNVDKPLTYDESTIVDELFKQTHKTKQPKNLNEDFITIERDNQYPKNIESPDGGFFSKECEPIPTSPTFKKKGLTRRETFEERCRQILGMEEDGDTQGTFKPQPDLNTVTDDDDDNIREKPTDVSRRLPDANFEVQIEDCDDEDEDKPFYINNIKETLNIKTSKIIPVVKEPKEQKHVLDTEEIIDTKVITKKPQIKKEGPLEVRTPEICKPVGDLTEFNVYITENTTEKVTREIYDKTDSDMEQEEPLSPNKAQPTKNVNPKSPITKKRPSTSPEPKQDHVVTRKTIVSTYTDDNEKTSDKLTQGKPKQQYSEDKTDSDMEEEEPLTRNKAQPTKNVNPKSPISKKRPSTSPEPKHDHVVTRKTIVSTYTDDNKKTTDKFTQGKPKEQYPEDKTTSDLEQKEPLSPTKGRPIKNVNQKSPVTEQRRSTSPEVKRDHLTTKKTFVTKYTDDIEKTTKTDFEQEKQLTKNSIVSTYDNIPHTDDIENIKDKAEQYEPKERYPEDTIDLDFEQEELLSTIKPQSTKNVNQKSPVTGTHRPNYPGPKHDHAVTRKTIVTTYQDDIEKTAKNRYPSDKIDCDFEGPLTNKSPSSPTKRNPTKNSKQKMPVEKLHSKSPEPKRANLTTKRNIVTTNTEEVETISDKVSHVKPDSSTETDSESAQYTSEIETEQENFISERVINCNNIIWIEEPVPESEKSSIEKPKKKAPKTNLSPVRKSPSKNPSKFESEPKTSSLRESSPIKQKPMEPFSKPKPVDKSFVPSKSVTKTVDDNIEFTENRKTSKSSTIVKTTANHVILNNKDIQLNNKTQFKSPKQPSKETPSRIKSKDSEIKEKTVEEHRQPRKPTTETTTSTMKDRLRSSARKDASKKDDVDANSSPDTSPTRNTERRRSSNISVHTEIIIDHSGPKSPKNESAPKKQQPNLQNHASTKEFTVKTMFDKTSRKMPVTERKESAPVPRVTRKDKDIKMSRSTSENVFKVTGKPTKKPEMNTLYPGTASKTDRRPSKCFTTKTINLTTTNKLMKSDDMENIIIDIQHAKSSREPSPDKIVPTPVPIHLDTGKPRYPDVVQEPEDEPRKKPVVKNIPIFEEDTNDFINCQISEIHTDKTATSSDFTDYEILDNPTVEAPQSLDYPSLRKPDDDDCLLSVHEKVSKFTHTAEEVKKPKASSPFNRDFDTTPIVPENDECLLTVDQKVTKFLRTAESITKHPITPVREIERPNFDDLDEELRQDECILSVSQKVNKFINTAEKLAPAAPQKSPELVARIERNISRQSEPEQPIPSEEDDEPIPFSPNHTVEIEVKRQKDILSRPTAWGKKNQKKDSSEYTKYDVVNQNDFHTTDENSETVVTKTTKMYEDDDDDELVPMTKSHTTSIELKRQKDILSRPSVFESRKAPENVHKKPFNLSERPQQFDNIKQSDKDKKSPRYVEPTNNKTTSTVELKIRKDSPTEITKTDERKVNKHKTSTVSTTRARFESTPKDNNTLPRRKPSTESDKPKQLFSENIKQQVVSKRKPFTEPQQPCDNEIEDNKYQTTETITETTTSHPESYPKTMDKNPNNHEGFLPQSKDHIHRKSFDKKSPNPNEVSHSPTSSTGRSTSTTVTKITERTLKHTPSKTPENEFVEPILEQPIGGKSSPSTPGRSKVITETVATRRNIFEKSIPSRPSKSPTPVPTGRRPSYMDHTKSSLEHTRRDSLEINKNNYSRKSSIEDDVELRPNSAVKFDIPQKSRKEPSISEDINIEEVFELKVLEQLLETVTSYEIRRRIRAQIRLVKKNMINTLPTIDKNKLDTKISSSISSTQKSSTYSSKVHYEETDDLSDRKHSKPQDRSRSPKKETDSLHHVETVSVSKDKYTKKRLDRSHSPDEKIISRSTKVPTDRCRSPEGSTDSQHRVEQDRYTKKPRDRSHSPDAKTISSSLKEVRRVSDAHTSTNRAHTFKEETDMVVVHSPRLMRKQPSAEVRPEQVNKPQTPELSYSPEHKHTPKPSTRNRSPECHGKPVVRERSISPQSKKKLHPRKGSTSPDGKTTKQPARSHSPTTKTTRQHEEMYSTISKTSSSKTTTQSPERKASTPKANEKTPIWADRKNILKNPSASGSTAKKAPFSPTTRTTASATKSVKSTTTTSQQQLQQRQRNKTMQEEDSIISSYGIGPTDENGLPLFGIRALKKKKPAQQPCETTEVTGYVVEEKYYSDNKTKPIVERKQLIYSTNADELEQIKSTVENINSSNDDGVIRSYQKIDKDLIQNEPKAILSGDEEFSTLSSRYTTRRGSVKEMSEKFIRKESSQSITEKSSSYPKAGLILRTNSRKGSVTDAADFFESENYTKTTSDVSHRSGDDDRETEGECEMNEMQRSSRMVTESESECESLNIHREVSKKSSSSSTSTRSFLNTTGESKIVTGVDDVLERMRNADNVVEEGDTAEDQEARSLLNKFLGASVIMRGVETVLPSSTKQTKTTTTYATSDGGDKLRKQAVKTTRVTKTIKSESSSSPVTSTTCAIEEIWDEEILKELLDQAKTYEERRKIRARLRELMAEREEKNHKAGEKSAPAVTEPEVEETEESSASEYEEIIEEVTDSSETEEETEKEPSVKQVAETNKINEEKESNKIEKENLKKSSSVESFKSAEATATVAEENTRKSVETQSKEQADTAVAAAVPEVPQSSEIAESASSAESQSETTDQTDSSEDKGEKEQQHSTSTTEQTETKEKDGAVITTTKVTTRTITGGAAPKPVSPFAKFRQLDKQNSVQSPKSPSTPTTPGGGTSASPSSGSAPIFRFTDPALNARAATVKDQLLQWCQIKTKEYENVQVTNFSASWSDGLAFCALIHHFLPDAFDYSKLTKQSRRHNFELAFTVADEKAGIAPLLDVEDMVEMSRPDWKCVFVYVQSIYRRFRNCQ